MYLCFDASTSRSHPSWVCGLKPIGLNNADAVIKVTPFVGVWIETLLQRIDNMRAESHPSWVCGLKLVLAVTLRPLVSHTLRGCVD